MIPVRSALVPKGHSKPIGAYSPGVQVAVPAGGSLVFVSGQVATDAMGQVLFEDDAGGQARVAFERMAQVLAEAGASLSELVNVTIYLTNLSDDFAAVSAVRDASLAVPPPASVLVEVSRLAEPGCRVEISGIAVTVGGGA